jgi:hypothetical protein
MQRIIQRLASKRIAQVTCRKVIFRYLNVIHGDTWWRSLLRHCATRRKVAGWIPEFVIGRGVDSTSNRNEYQEYSLGYKSGRCVGLTALPPSCADCHVIWEPQPPGSLRACPQELLCLLILFMSATNKQFTQYSQLMHEC